MLSINRHESDILMRAELEEMAASPTYKGRLEVAFSLTAPPVGWDGWVGRGSQAMVRAALPPPTGDGKTMILVCGTDGFVGDMAGPVERVRDPVTNKKSKIQGPVLGVLGELGFEPHQVFKL